MVSRKMTRGLSLAVGLAIGVSLLAGPPAFGAINSSFCSDRVAYDYGRAFRSMPALKQVPRSGHLPFASKDISFDTPQEPILVPYGSRRTFSLDYRLTVLSGVELKQRVEWLMIARLVRVNAKGSVLQSIETRRAKLDGRTAKEIDGSGVVLSVNSGTAFYRVEIEFKKDGRPLKRYGEYFRVVAPTRHTSLALSPTKAVNVGQTIAFKVMNSGTLPARYGEPFEIDKRVAGGWSPYPLEFGPRNGQLFGLGSGLSGMCQRFTVPAEMAAGRYRVRKEMRDPARMIAAVFEVQ